jgi:membrane associated rhomboid family serine protease
MKNMKDQFKSQEKHILINPNPDLSQTNTIDTCITIPHDSLYHPKPHWPVFTVTIGLLDVFMLLVVYIVQEGTVLTSDTWIKMGCKYVPCMKPVYSKAEQEIYNVGLKTQCESFPFPYQFFRFFTPIFLHGSITHLLSNLVCQALAGTLLEGKYGTKTLGICYILFGFSGNIMSALCNPKSISVGASGAVYGLLFFCMIDITLQVLTSDDSREKIVQYLITCLIIPYFIMSVFFTVDISGRTDHAAHIGGVIMGILVAIYLCKMPEFITKRIFNGEERIRLIAFISILSYFLFTLFIFYLFIPVNLK